MEPRVVSTTKSWDATRRCFRRERRFANGEMAVDYQDPRGRWGRCVIDGEVVEWPIVAGLGPDAPLAVNEHGGRQSHLPYRLDLLPAQATLAVGKVLKHGADKYGENNWHAISTREHLAHLLAHVFAYLAGDASDDHLEHAACRALMALEIKKRGGPVDHNRPPQGPASSATAVEGAHAACGVATPDFEELDADFAMEEAA